MSKVYIVTQSRNQDQLLDAMGTLGVLHVAPVDAARAVAREDTLEAITDVNMAIRILEGMTPKGKAPDVCALDAAREAIALHKAILEEREQLQSLHRQADQLAMWGSVELSTLRALRDSGLEIQFFMVQESDLPALEAECLEVLTRSSQGVLIAVIDRTGQFAEPEGAKPVPWPVKDLPSVNAEAEMLDTSIKENDQVLAELAVLTEDLKDYRQALGTEARLCITQRSGMNVSTLFAIQGWVPSSKASALSDQLKALGIEAAVDTMEPEEEEDAPPTLIEYPKWALPIRGLFEVLGTVAGYREFDVSIPFMLALPIFAAMLIGDGGYGAILFIGLLLGYKKIAPAIGDKFTQLLIIVGAVSLLWGCLCGSFFGYPLIKHPIIPVNMSDESRYLLMQISFILGTIHLSTAQVWQSVKLFPDLRFLGKTGWAIFIWGMLGVVKMFVLNTELTWATPWPYLLITGTALAILFDSPSKNILKMVLTGVANYPLAMLGAFSDIISYVRLMAVGLASGVLAESFNQMASDSGSLFISIPTLVFGHSLNLGLAMIALFAHGVRLNMLEFSNNLGMQWTGYVYKPFSKEMIQE
jgi:V/A-type H+-transporting ATPase subunit I